MGCGASTFYRENATLHDHSHRDLLDHGSESVDSSVKQRCIHVSSHGKDVIGVDQAGGEAKAEPNNEEKWVDKKEVEMKFENEGKEELRRDDKHEKIDQEDDEETMTTDRDDSFIGPASPSFREYCIDYTSCDRSSCGDFNDSDLGESSKNGGDDDSTKRKNKPQKELEKKETMGRRFRNVIQKESSRGKRNFLNFTCYNSSNASNAESARKEAVGKAA